MTNPTLDLSKYDLNGVQDLVTITSGNNQLALTVEKSYYQINVASAMESLAQVGKLLQLAHASSMGFSCSKTIIAILSDYQSLSTNSVVATGTFVDACVTSVKWHKYALKSAESKKFEAALKIIQKSGELAKKMAEVSGKLAQEAQELCVLAKQALVQATDDQTITTEKKREVLQKVREAEEQEAKLASLAKSLADDVSRAEQKEREAIKRAEKASKRAFIASLVSAVALPVAQAATAYMGGAGSTLLSSASSSSSSQDKASESKPTEDKALQAAAAEKNEKQNELESDQIALKKKQKLLKFAKERNEDAAKIKQLEDEIATLEARVEVKQEALTKAAAALEKVAQKLGEQADGLLKLEAQAAASRDNLQREKRAADAELAKTVTVLKNTRCEKDSLDQAIASLVVTVQTMGKIKTVFENARLFWEGVNKHCEKLTDTEILQIAHETDQPEMFIEALKDSGWHWCVLGKICHTANTSILKVHADVNHIMTNLPSLSEAQLLIQQVSASILDQIKKDSLAIEQISNEAKK